MSDKAQGVVPSSLASGIATHGPWVGAAIAAVLALKELNQLVGCSDAVVNSGLSLKFQAAAQAVGAMDSGSALLLVAGLVAGGALLVRLLLRALSKPQVHVVDFTVFQPDPRWVLGWCAQLSGAVCEWFHAPGSRQATGRPVQRPTTQLRTHQPTTHTPSPTSPPSCPLPPSLKRTAAGA